MHACRLYFLLKYIFLLFSQLCLDSKNATNSDKCVRVLSFFNLLQNVSGLKQI